MSKINTPYFRVAFPSVFQPKLNKLKNKEEYSLVALFPIDADLSALKAAAREACEKKWGKDPSQWPQNLRSPFRNQGDRRKKNDAGQMVLPEGYVDGAIYLNLSSSQRPGLVDAGMGEIIDTADFYGGCWARASVTVYAYDQGANRGVNFGLGNIQKWKDDQPFGNKTKPQDDFSPVASPSASVGGGQAHSAASMFS